MSRPFVTASAIERVIECPASAVLPQTQNTSTYADRGRKTHAEIEDIALGLKDQTSDGISRELLQMPDGVVPELCFSYDCVTGIATEVGRVSGRNYPKAPFSTIFGTADAVGRSLVNDEICVDVVDWKNTYEAPPPNSWQLRLLSFMAAKARGLNYARSRITHIRDGVRHSRWFLWDKEDFKQTEEALKKAYDQVNKLGWKESIGLGDVKFGPHCHFCPAYLSCPYPKSLLSSRDMSVLVALTDGDASDAYARWQALRTLVGRMEDAVKAYAVQKPIHIGNGYLYGRPGGEGTNFRKYKLYNPGDDD